MERRLEAEVDQELREWVERAERREAALPTPAVTAAVPSRMSVAEFEVRAGQSAGDTRWELDREIERERTARQYDDEYLARYADEQRPGASW